MVYPTVADLYARGNLSNTSLPNDYKIQKANVTSRLYTNITTTIKNCLIDYCAALPGCTEGLKDWDLNRNDRNASSPYNLTSSFYLYKSGVYTSEYYDDATSSSRFDLCDYVPESLNADIGGIGVQ